MKQLILSIFLVFTLLLNLTAQSLSTASNTDFKGLYNSVIEEYGFDQVLVNGVIYSDKYRNKIGHAFFPYDQFYPGTIEFRGKEYSNVELKYDVLNQQLVLLVHDQRSEVWLIPHFDFVSAFSFDGRNFGKFEIDGENGFYQILYNSDRLKSVCYWYKEVREVTNNGKSVYYEILEFRKKTFLNLNGNYYRYKNNKTFTALFPDEIKIKVKEYLKTNRIRVAESSDESFRALLLYCDSLL